MRKFLSLLAFSLPLLAQNATLAPVPHLQFFDASGRPLAGGKLYTCVAGTACPGNPLATYTDATATVQNANPVVLDASGYANLWIGSGSYKLVAQNSAGVQQWTQDNVSGLGSLKGANGAALVNYTAPGGVTRTVASVLDETVSPLSYGAKCDGATVDNAAFLAAASTGKAVRIPSATCVVDSLELPAGTTLLGQGAVKSILKPGASGNVFTFTGTSASHKQSLSISGVGFVASSFSAGKAAITATYADHVTIRESAATEITLLLSNPGLTYSAVSQDTLNLDTTFTGNSCTSSQTANDYCAFFGYSNGVTATHNRVYGFRQGLEYWGGDANANGAVANTRWAQNIKFANNHVEGSGAATWGSMGLNVTMTGNTAKTISDVAFDVEGTVNATITGNTCTDAVHGCYTTFFLNRGIVFEGNTATQSSTNYPLFKVFNSSLTTSNRDITVIGNTFVCTDATTACHADNGSGPAQRITFSQNTLSNTVITFNSALNQGELYITDNKLLFDLALSVPAISAKVYAATAHISDNKVISTLSQSGTGIYAQDADGNNSNTYWVKTNYIARFANAINTVTGGTNSGITATFVLDGNRVGTGTITSSDTGNEHSLVTQTQPIQMDGNGDVYLGAQTVAGNASLTNAGRTYLGTAASVGSALDFVTGSVAFNMRRDPTSGNWKFGTDGTNSGGTIMTGSPAGHINFWYAPSQGPSPLTQTDSYLVNLFQLAPNGSTLTGSLNATAGYKFNGTAGVTVSGTSCTIKAIAGGIITQATCP